MIRFETSGVGGRYGIGNALAPRLEKRGVVFGESRQKKTPVRAGRGRCAEVGRAKEYQVFLAPVDGTGGAGGASSTGGAAAGFAGAAVAGAS